MFPDFNMEALMHEASSAETKSAGESASSKFIEAESGGDVEIVDTEKNAENGMCNLYGFSRLPQRVPVDLQFENVTFTAALGFRKGKIKVTNCSLIKRTCG